MAADDSAMDIENPLEGPSASKISTNSEEDVTLTNPFLSPRNESSSTEGANAVEIEILDRDEFEFLDGVAQLGVLQTELNDVRLGLARSRNNGQYVPLKLFRSREGNSINVTDIHTSLWCEVQVEYKYLHPHLKKTPVWTQLEKQGKPVLLTTPAMKQGATMHLIKELEVHDIVRVQTVTREDRWAVDLIKSYVQLSTIKSGKMEREIAVFGDPYDTGFLIKGIIDQVEYSVETGELSITDYKTRRNKSLPQQAQKQGYSLQLMLYKRLLDSLTCGATKVQLLESCQSVSFSQSLTDGPLDYISKCGLQSLLPKAEKDTVTFGAVAECMLSLIKGLNLPLASSMMIHYEYQHTGELLGIETVQYDEEWMKEKVKSSLEFWTGTRPAEGVSDIEDLWKCEMCQFRDVCSWRWQKSLELSPAARSQS